MKKERSYSLLSKTSAIYLLFTLVAFLAGGLFLWNEGEAFITRNLDHRFTKWEGRTRHHIEEGKPLSELPRFISAIPLATAPDSSLFPIYSDTLIQNAELDEMHRFRKKTILLEAGGRIYKVGILAFVEDFRRLQDDVFEALVPAFVLLALAILVFNLLLSGYFFRPFNRILELMRTYKVGQKTKIEQVATSTSEFQVMQGLFHQMLDRIEHDYRHLKEYTENMAHEIQTPLAIIRTKTENLIADDRVMGHQAENVKVIYDETSHLSRLSKTLNLLTKIENGEFNKVEEIATRPVIERHLRAVDELANLKSLDLNASLSDQHQLVIDPFLLDIILKNLLKNAINYGTPEGPIRIHTDPQSLFISDFGAPSEVPPEKLFERFQGNPTPNNHSLGLGLALVQKICDLNDLRVAYQYQERQHIFSIR